MDTQDLDVFAMERVTCRWVRAQLTVAQDLFDRQILGLKVTPVSTKAVDVAGVLFEAVTGRGSGRPALGPAHGLPKQLVFTEFGADEPLWCPPETLVVDHGKAFLSAHVIGVCARLGISIQPAQPRKPTDKPTVERFFTSLREGLIQHLPAYKGPDLHSRGLRVEDQALLFLHELEDVIRDWIVSVHHSSGHDGLAIAEWPNLSVSPNEMFAVGIAKASLLRLPAAPELVFEFLRVAWRTIQHYGVEVDGRRYNGPSLDGHRNATRTDRFTDPNTALAEVLQRWNTGAVTDRRERRMAARLSAERAAILGLAAAELGEAAALSEHPQAAALDSAGTHLTVVTGDDDEETDVLEDVDGFYDDALEVLE